MRAHATMGTWIMRITTRTNPAQNKFRSKFFSFSWNLCFQKPITELPRTRLTQSSNARPPFTPPSSDEHVRSSGVACSHGSLQRRFTQHRFWLIASMSPFRVSVAFT